MNDFGSRVRAEEKKSRTPRKKLQNTVRPTGKKRGPAKGVITSPETLWKPGQSGNPGGRPKWKPISQAYAQQLEELHPDQKKYKGLTRAQVIARNMLEAAESGDTQAAREVTDRTEGKVPQGLEHAGRDGGAIQFTELSPEENEARIAELLGKTAS